MPHRPIRFFHRGAIVEVDGAAPTRTVLDWLREDARCTGTKEGCNEGDCGACTVVIGEVARDGDAGAVRGLALRTVNACIQFLPTLDGKALFTVEDLKRIAATAGAAATAAPKAGRHAHGPALHPVQQAMVECHGSQCGFCTPGFVMSLWAGYERHRACGERPTRQQLADELSGNLCRCTGYRPILDAGERMFELPAAELDTAPALAALRTLSEDPPLEYEAQGARLLAPRTLDEFAALREAHPQAQILAGSTDVGLWVNKQFRPLPELLYVGGVRELARIDARDDGTLSIGAAASLEEAWQALAARWPSLTELWLRFASPPVRNAGTMGGNVANGSPIGDSAPALMALDARLELRRGARVREVALDAFYVDYMKNRLEPGEFVQAILVPPAASGTQVRAYKISKRFDCDISALCAGLAIALDDKGRVADVRLAWGGMAATVRRAAAAEAALRGRPWNEDAVRAAQDALGEDFKPMSDMRASAAYRLQVARNLLRRFWLETRRENPLPAEATRAWSTMPAEARAARIAQESMR
jgi:xanthine dehydrogenase small subunit